MLVYIAHNFCAREWLCNDIEVIEAAGHTVTSRWIKDDSHVGKGRAVQSAIADCEDIDKADFLILYVDQYGERHGRGKFFELGYAVAKGKQVILLGESDGCVFYALPGLMRTSSLENAVKILGGFQGEGK